MDSSSFIQSLVSLVQRPGQNDSKIVVLYSNDSISARYSRDDYDGSAQVFCRCAKPIIDKYVSLNINLEGKFAEPEEITTLKNFSIQLDRGKISVGDVNKFLDKLKRPEERTKKIDEENSDEVIESALSILGKSSKIYTIENFKPLVVKLLKENPDEVQKIINGDQNAVISFRKRALPLIQNKGQEDKDKNADKDGVVKKTKTAGINPYQRNYGIYRSPTFFPSNIMGRTPEAEFNWQDFHKNLIAKSKNVGFKRFSAEFVKKAVINSKLDRNVLDSAFAGDQKAVSKVAIACLMFDSLNNTQLQNSVSNRGAAKKGSTGSKKTVYVPMSDYSKTEGMQQVPGNSTAVSSNNLGQIKRPPIDDRILFTAINQNFKKINNSEAAQPQSSGAVVDKPEFSVRPKTKDRHRASHSVTTTFTPDTKAVLRSQRDALNQPSVPTAISGAVQNPVSGHDNVDTGKSIDRIIKHLKDLRDQKTYELTDEILDKLKKVFPQLPIKPEVIKDAASGSNSHLNEIIYEFTIFDSSLQQSPPPGTTQNQPFIKGLNYFDEPEDVVDGAAATTSDGLPSIDGFSSLPPVTKEQEKAFETLKGYYTALTTDDLPELIRQRFLSPMAVAILGDKEDYRHRYKAQEVFQELEAFKKQKLTDLANSYRKYSMPYGAIKSISAGELLPHVSPNVSRIKEKIFKSGVIMLERSEFDAYFDGVDTEIIEKMGSEKFQRFFCGFLEMKALLAAGTVYEGLSQEEVDLIKKDSPEHIEATDLNPQDFHILLNNNLITEKEIQNINRGGLQAAMGPYKRILQQVPVVGMNGAGLASWGNTCWINTGIQTMLRTIPSRQIECLNSQEDVDIDRVRLTFQRLMKKGQDIISGKEPPSVITREQSDFLEALLICGRAGKLGCMNPWFNRESIPEIPQADSADFIGRIRSLLGLNDDRSQTMDTVSYYQTTCNGKKYYKKKEGDIGQVAHALPCFRAVNRNPETIKMIDWFHSITEMEASGKRLLPWSLDDLQLTGDKDAVFQLASQEKCMLKVDTHQFKRTVLAMNATLDVDRELARQALLNSSWMENNELRIPVMDSHDNKQKTLVMRLSGAGLHCGTALYGHYIHMSLDPDGKCEIQDDRISEPFELYRNYLLGGDKIQSWQEMVKEKKMVPAYCEYEFVRMEG